MKNVNNGLTFTDTNPNNEMDVIAQIKHHCCAAAFFMVIFGGAEIYLDEGLELSWDNMWLLIWKEINWQCKQSDLDPTSFNVATSVFSMAVKT